MKNIFTLLFLTISLISKGQLTISNNTEKRVTICIAWYSESKKCFITKGWWNIEPGQSIMPGLNFTSDKDEFYYHAYSEGSKWEGEYKLLTRKVAFSIPFAELESTKEDNPDYEWKSFRKKTVNFENGKERKYNLSLTANKENINESIKFKVNKSYTQEGKTYLKVTMSNSSNRTINKIDVTINYGNQYAEEEYSFGGTKTLTKTFSSPVLSNNTIDFTIEINEELDYNFFEVVLNTAN